MCAELVQGAGREVPRFLYVFVGTFVGGGLVLDGLDRQWPTR
jgi:predicted NBD/HSP70 family sugar kinase